MSSLNENLIQDPFNIYKNYVIIKSHFTTNYDYFKYSGKLPNITEKSFQNRKDRAFFHALAKFLNKKTTIPFFISQFIDSPDLWIGTILEDVVTSQKRFNTWKSRIMNIRDNYTSDLKVLSQYNSSWVELLKQKNEDHSIAQKLAYSNRISPETYSLLINLFSIEQNNDLIIDNDMKYRKYRPFLSISKKELLELTPKSLIFDDINIIK